jgi:hypothetical protein
MNTLEFHDPSGADRGQAAAFAPRVSGLAGKRVGFVSNEQWQAFRMLPLLKIAARGRLSQGSRCCRSTRSRRATR